MLHIRDKKTIIKLITTWNQLLSEKSQVRMKINPELAKVNIGMLRGIPINDDEVQVKFDTQNQYNQV